MKINVKTVLNPKQSDKVLKAKLLKNLQVQIREWNDGAGREKGHENHEISNSKTAWKVFTDKLQIYKCRNIFHLKYCTIFGAIEARSRLLLSLKCFPPSKIQIAISSIKQQ